MLFDLKLQKGHGQVTLPFDFKDPISNYPHLLPHISLEIGQENLVLYHNNTLSS